MNKQEFHQLIDKYLDGGANLEEEKLLLNFIASFQASTDWDERVMGIKKELEEKMLTRLIGSVAKTNQVKEKHRSIFWLKGAAAALIIAGASMGLYFMKTPGDVKDDQASTRFKNDLLPGSSRAVLTLADGSKVNLDGRVSGLVAQEGRTAISKTTQGELVYQEDAKHIGQAAINMISTPSGGKYKLTLPDGTRVWLNAASSLKFQVSFTGKERIVELLGEAYFEVAKASRHGQRMPFKVKTRNTNITVLGTHFNVSAYPDEINEETTLLEGSVRISSGKQTSVSTQSKILKPGQQAKISTTAPEISVISDVNLESVMAWKSDVFMFDSTPIEKVMQQVGRWYNAEIIYDGPRPDIFFNGVIPRSSYASELLEILESAGRVKFRIEGNKIIVQKK